MELLLLPLVKGFFSLAGVASLAAYSALQELELQIEEMQFDVEEAEQAEVQPKFEFKQIPEKE